MEARLIPRSRASFLRAPRRIRRNVDETQIYPRGAELPYSATVKVIRKGSHACCRCHRTIAPP